MLYSASKVVIKSKKNNSWDKIRATTPFIPMQWCHCVMRPAAQTIKKVCTVLKWKTAVLKRLYAVKRN